MKGTWDGEALKWKHTKGFNIVPIVGPNSRRDDLLSEHLTNNEHVDVFVISLGLWEWLAGWCIKHNIIFWDWLILDESHNYKSQSTNRSYYAKTAARSSSRVTLLTGTPSSKGYHNLYAQMQLLVDHDDENPFGKNYDHFLKRFFFVDHEKRITIIRGEEEKREVEKLCKGYFFRYDAADYKQQVSINDKIIVFDMPEPARQLYNSVNRSHAGKWSGYDIIAEEDTTKNSKLAQIASGNVITAEGESVHVHDAKIEALLDLMIDDRNLLVAYYYTADRDRILKKIPNAKHFKGKEKDIDHWNENPDSGLVYVCSPASVSAGINLQQGGYTGIWYSLPRGRRDAYDQFMGRIARQGQENEVTFYTLLCANTIDQKDYQNLIKDGKQQEVFLNNIKANQ